MTQKKKFIYAALAGLCAFIVLRLVVLPSQLNATPYRDETLGADLLRLLFLQIPAWISAASVVVFSGILLLLKRKDSTHRENAASQ